MNVTSRYVMGWEMCGQARRCWWLWRRQRRGEQEETNQQLMLLEMRKDELEKSISQICSPFVKNMCELIRGEERRGKWNRNNQHPTYIYHYDDNLLFVYHLPTLWASDAIIKSWYRSCWVDEPFAFNGSCEKALNTQQKWISKFNKLAK